MAALNLKTKPTNIDTESVSPFETRTRRTYEIGIAADAENCGVSLGDVDHDDANAEVVGISSQRRGGKTILTLTMRKIVTESY